MTEWTCAEARISLGVYVLGAIDPSERGLVDAHLATCRDCRDELAGLASLPALLARVTPEELDRIEAEAGPVDEEPPRQVVGAVLDLAAARRRRSRWRYAAAAAAVVALAGGVFGGLASAGSTPAVPFSPGAGAWHQEQGANSVNGASAYIDYATEHWGTVLAAEVDGIAENTTCELRVRFTDGTWVNAASWTTAADEGNVWYWGSLPAVDETGKQISEFQIISHGTTLLNVPV